MKKSVLLIVAVFFLSFFVSSIAADDDKPEETMELNGKIVSISTKALESADGRLLRTPGIITTDFEVTDTFVPGPCGGQNSWSMFAASANEGHIDTSNPAGGSQHLRISYEPAAASPALTGCFSPDMGPRSNTFDTLSLDIYISAIGGADYDVVGQAPSQGFLTFRVKFDWLGNIYVLDDLGSGTTFVDTGANWIVGSYRNLRVDINAPANTINYYYDGLPIYSGAAGIFAGNSIEQVVLLSDNFHAGDVGDFDNLNVTTPGPTNIVLTTFAIHDQTSPLNLLLVTSTFFLLMSLSWLVIRKQARHYPSK